MTAERDTEDELDDVFVDERPQVRRWRMILGSVVGFVGMVLVVWSCFALRNPGPEPQGSAAAVGQAYMSIVAWVTLFVGALIAVGAALTLVTALIEARAACRAEPRNPVGTESD
jgi:drug/metabolite transporter (DMT)-like permease